MKLDTVLTATREVEAPDLATLAHGRHTALTAVHDDLTSRARLARRRVRRRVASVATIAAATAAFSFAARTSEPTQPNAAPPVVEVEYANASQILGAAANAAGAGADTLGEAPYWKVVSEYAQTDTAVKAQNSTGERTIWQGIAGPSVLSDTFGGSAAETVSQPQSVLELGGRTYSWRDVNSDGLTSAQVHALLTEGEAGRPAKEGRPSKEWYFFKQAGDLLSESPASPEIRKALWKELGALTGVTSSGKVEDAAGRSGWNLTFKLEGHGSQRYVVDPSTGAILQSEVEVGSAIHRVTYLEAGPATSAPEPGR